MEQGGDAGSAAGAALIDELDSLANAGDDVDRPHALQSPLDMLSTDLAIVAEVANAILQKKPARVRELLAAYETSADLGVGVGALFRLALRWDCGSGSFRALAEAGWEESGAPAVAEAAFSGRRDGSRLLLYLSAGEGARRRRRAFEVFERAAWGRSEWGDQAMRVAGVLFPRSKRITKVVLRILLRRLGVISRVSAGGGPSVTVAWPAIGVGLRGRPRFAAAEVRSALSRIRAPRTLRWFLAEVAKVPGLEKAGLEYLLQEMGARFRPELFFPEACALCLRVGPQLVDLTSLHDWLLDLHGEEDRLGPTPVAVLVDIYVRFPSTKIDVRVFMGLVERTSPEDAAEAVGLIKEIKENMSKSERLTRWGVLKALKNRANSSEGSEDSEDSEDSEEE